MGCTLYDGGTGEWYLNRFEWVRCRPASTEYLTMLGLSVPVLILFIIGFPIFLWRKCKQYKNFYDGIEDPRYSFITLPYEDVTIYFYSNTIVRSVRYAAQSL